MLQNLCYDIVVKKSELKIEIGGASKSISVWFSTSLLQLLESNCGGESYCDLIPFEPQNEKGMWTTTVPGYKFKFISQNDAQCRTHTHTHTGAFHLVPRDR